MGHFHLLKIFTRFLMIVVPLLLLLSDLEGASATTFTFINKCQYTVWPGILSGAGRPNLETTGFVLPSGASRSLPSPAGWSGRFWGRTGCNFDQSGHGSCATADCGSGQVECNGAGAAPPATLAEFTLNGDSSQDFYDVSLVDGYNLPMVVEASGGSGVCGSTGCVVDINQRCPAELRAGDGGACKSACDAFGSPEYCCSGAYNSAAACKPSVYAQLFKSACPRSYSYAYDDATSTFTCSAADYAITFCPSLPSQKSTMDTPIGSGDGSGSGAVIEPESGLGSGPGALFAGGGPSWMANLATATSDGSHPAFAVKFWVLIIGYVILCLIK